MADHERIEDLRDQYPQNGPLGKPPVRDDESLASEVKRLHVLAAHRFDVMIANKQTEARASVPAEGDGETARTGLLPSPDDPDFWGKVGVEVHDPETGWSPAPGGGEDRDTLLLPNHGEPQVYEDTRSVAGRLAAEPASEDGAK